ncbi:hypothetical protein LY78DRAFT_641532 [Colletotrichum sublineola]|nr:hypothetical protein LY78DRAFT_641532 [Colletotrichum sublineola]
MSLYPYSNGGTPGQLTDDFSRIVHLFSEAVDAIQLHAQQKAMTNGGQPSTNANGMPASAAPNELVVYDKDGDLTIRVGSRLRPYRVDSKTLSRSSPVFKRMLFGGFAESRPSDGGDWVVDLPDDRSASMEILFRIVHGAFEMVPTQLSLGDLYTVLAHTEKYDATRLLRPWAKTWLHNPVVRNQTGEPELLCVAWELGDSDLFRQVMEAMTNECYIDMKGNVLCGKRRMFYGPHNDLRFTPPEFLFKNLVCLVPPDMEGIVSSNRKRLVAAELEPYVNLYAASRSTRCKQVHSRDGWKCDSQVLGSLIKSLSGAGVDITNPNIVEVYRGSVANLRRALDHTHIETFCSDCAQSIPLDLGEGKAKAALLRAEITTVQDGHRKYLESQARKTGL